MQASTCIHLGLFNDSMAFKISRVSQYTRPQDVDLEHLQYVSTCFWSSGGETAEEGEEEEVEEKTEEAEKTEEVEEPVKGKPHCLHLTLSVVHCNCVPCSDVIVPFIVIFIKGDNSTHW